jgi:ferredoxin
VRRLIQSLCLAGFLLLFFWVCWPYGSRQYAEAFRAREIVEGELFLLLDPLVSVSTAIAARTLVWSLAVAAGVILVSLLLPRAFCGYVCPLGTLFDVLDWFVGGRVRFLRLPRHGWWSFAKYCLLAVIVTAAVFGVVLSAFFAAIPVLTRAMLFVLAPAQTGLLAGWYLVPPMNLGHWLSISLFALMLGLVFLGRRFWCRCVCPTGALFSLCNTLRLTERKVTDKCVRCGRCVDACPFDAINDDFSTRSLDCASCRTCSGVCPTGAIEFTWRQRRNGESGWQRQTQFADGVSRGESEPSTSSEDFACRCHPEGGTSHVVAGMPAVADAGLSRRGMLIGLGGTAVAGVGVPLAIGSGRVQNEPPIRPPGSVPENEFLQLCVRCGQCVKVCPNNVLQPAGLELGFNGLWTPRVVPDWSGCEPSCNNCGQVCPTGAVRALALEEKRAARIGLAEVDCEACLPHAGRGACQLCVDECRMAGYNAIEFVRVGTRLDENGEPVEGSGYLAPVVREDLCVGCGLCQMRCRSINVKSEKLLTDSAIHVVAGPGREDRIVSGSYRALQEERTTRRREQQGTTEDTSGGTEYLPDFLK